VHDQDEALAFYTTKLGMEVRSDATMPEMGNFRWLTVGPVGQPDISIVLMAIPGEPLMDAATADQVRSLMARGFAGTVFLTTDDCRREYEELSARGVEFTETPEERPYGIDAGFRDPSGNALRLTQIREMAAEPLDAVDVHWHGLAGDRRWAFIQDGLERSGFPWLTIRERADMGHHRPVFADPSRPNASVTLIRTPDGEELDVVDPALAARLGDGVRVIKQDRGVFDTAPLSLLTTQTVAALEDLAGRDLDPLRFRPNLLVEGTGG
jgi:predicted enzyme related to lactoylglutathione lyase